MIMKDVEEMSNVNAVRNDQSITMQRGSLQRYPKVRQLLAPIYRRLHAPKRISGFASNLHQRLATQAANVKQGGTRISAATLYPPRIAKALMKTKDSMAVVTIKLCCMESERNYSNRHDNVRIDPSSALEFSDEFVEMEADRDEPGECEAQSARWRYV